VPPDLTMLAVDPSSLRAVGPSGCLQRMRRRMDVGAPVPSQRWATKDRAATWLQEDVGGEARQMVRVFAAANQETARRNLGASAFSSVEVCLMAGCGGVVSI
jgi:hypothetical protein